MRLISILCDTAIHDLFMILTCIEAIRPIRIPDVIPYIPPGILDEQPYCFIVCINSPIVRPLHTRWTSLLYRTIHNAHSNLLLRIKILHNRK